jgi:hypothetical protein
VVEDNQRLVGHRLQSDTCTRSRAAAPLSDLISVSLSWSHNRNFLLCWCFARPRH